MPYDNALIHHALFSECYVGAQCTLCFTSVVINAIRRISNKCTVNDKHTSGKKAAILWSTYVMVNIIELRTHLDVLLTCEALLP